MRKNQINVFSKTGARLKIFRQKNVLKKNCVQKIKEKKAVLTTFLSCRQIRKVITMSKSRKWEGIVRNSRGFYLEI